jgi:formylglycine-generating enzyme
MKTKVTVFVLLFLFTTSLSAQSKKELNLIIDSLNSTLNNEKQVNIKMNEKNIDLTTQIEQMTNKVNILTSLLHTQDSINKVLLKKNDDLKIKNKPITNTSSTTVNGVPIEWAEIPAGTFLMGMTIDEKSEITCDAQGGILVATEPLHQVSLSAFKMSKYEITFKQYDLFCEATGREKLLSNLIEGRDKYPVIDVNWDDATAFAKWMGCRLPTEAEWEYACRAGTVTSFNTGNNIDSSQASINQLMPIGSHAPNAWGLYDMHGNAAEWCNDYADRYDYVNRYIFKPQTNPQGPLTGHERIVRGGSSSNNLERCRSGERDSKNPNDKRSAIGIRLVLLK